jgi:site-specific DNA recombinase
MTQKAVIYCRVSDPAQVKNGSGLTSQETHCREYAKRCKYQVEVAFHEEGITGAIINRPQMQALLQYLRVHAKNEPYIVIIDDINRLARDLKTHIELRTLISAAGGKLESPSIEFGDNSDSRLIEHILATVAAHQREKNAEQVYNRMRARMMSGYWVFQAPCGYKFERVAGRGKILMRDEPVASIVQDALENFASGRFESPVEIKRFLELQPIFPKNIEGEIHLQRVIDLLNRQLYTGYMEYANWGIQLMRGHHEPIISMETYKQIQLRLKGKVTGVIRSDINQDFPLRGFILCDCCKRQLTASWSKGNSKRYAYYFCGNKKCPHKGKSISREVIETQFVDILRDIHPSAEFCGKTRSALEECWHQTIKEHDAATTNLTNEIRRIDRRMEQFIERSVDADSTLVAVYEAQIGKLETHKANLKRELDSLSSGKGSFDGFLESVREFIASPQKLWSAGDIVSKRLTLKLVFAEKLFYHRGIGFQPAVLAQPFAGSTTHRTEDSEFTRIMQVIGKNLLARKFGLYQPDHHIRACI